MAKILWVIHGAEVYGESRAICSLMRGVRDRGWSVEALTLTEGACHRQLVAGGFSVTCLHMDHSPSMHLARSRVGRMWEMLKLMAHQFPVRRRVLAELRRRRPDIVHFLSKNMLPAVGAAAKTAGIPSFWEMTAVISGGFTFDLNRRIYRVLHNWLRIRALANSRYTAGTIGQLRLPVQVMHLGADPNHFATPRSGGITRAVLGIPEDALVYVIVSRIDASKGQETFLQAMQEVNDPRTHTIIVGEATLESDRAYLEGIKQSLSPEIAKRVHFVGYSDTPEAYIAIADIGVNPRLDAEPFGLSVVEAMMMGKPVLVHALGGPAETVIDDVTGWHMPTASVEAFGAGIRRTLAQRDRWQAMGMAARERAVGKFSLPRQTQRYEELVEEALRQNSIGSK